MGRYTGKKKIRGPGEDKDKRKHELKREKLITKLENFGFGENLSPGYKLKNFTKYPTCLRCKSDISGVEESGFL